MCDVSHDCFYSCGRKGVRSNIFLLTHVVVTLPFVFTVRLFTANAH